MSRNFFILSSALALCCLPGAGQAQTVQDPYRINPALENFTSTISEGKLVKMGSNAYMAFGYDLANFGFIVGDTGVIVVDCGWFPGRTEKAFADLRKITDKPIVALIYTHGHADHVSGCPANMTGGRDIPVYISEQFTRYRDEQVSSRIPFILRRISDQLGFMLLEVPEGNVGTGIGKGAYSGTPTYRLPNRFLKGGEKLSIAGVTLEIIGAPSDNDDDVAVWLPDSRVMFASDVVSGVGPYLATPRSESGRDPENFVRAADILLRYPIEHLIPGHGRPWRGAAEVRAGLTDIRDISQFMIDAVVRAQNAGTSLEDMLADFELPAHLADNPDLQWFYHPRDWVLRGIYSRLGGWMTDDPMQLAWLPPKDEAMRVIEAMGGVDSVMARAQKAFDAGDARWAAQLALRVHKVEPDNALATSIAARALRTVAYDSPSSSERYYTLALAGTIDGTYKRDRMRPTVDIEKIFDAVPYHNIVEVLRPRISPAETADVNRSINLAFAGEGGVTLTIRRGVMQISDGMADASLPTLTTSRAAFVEALLGTMAGKSGMTALLDAKGVDASDPMAIKTFLGYIH